MVTLASLQIRSRNRMFAPALDAEGVRLGSTWRGIAMVAGPATRLARGVIARSGCAMRKRERFAAASAMLEVWAEWKVSVMDNQSEIGFPSQTMDAKLRSGGVGGGVSGSVVPTRGMVVPKRIRPVERAYTAFPDDVKAAVDIRYLMPDRPMVAGIMGPRFDKMACFAEATGRHKKDFYHCLEIAKAMITGHMIGGENNEHRE